MAHARKSLIRWLIFLAVLILSSTTSVYRGLGSVFSQTTPEWTDAPFGVNEPQKITTATDPPQPTSKCPPLVQQRKGIYNHTTDSNKFQNVILLTAVNHQFEFFLRNWEIIAGDWGLQWVVLSLDDTIYDILGGANQSILLPQQDQVQKAGKFRTPSYNKLVCNKVRMVLELLEECNVEIVFSDVDNIFLQDPFRHHLGDMIASGQYDYIYQTNHEWTQKPQQHDCIAKGMISLKEEGNTGFHYLRPTPNMKKVLAETLRRCDAKDNHLDDQTLLWNVMREGIKQSTWQHCPPFAFNQTHPDRLQRKNASQLCCLDPHYYSNGKNQPMDPSVLVTLHVNYGSRIRKKGKLKSWVKNGWRLPWGR